MKRKKVVVGKKRRIVAVGKGKQGKVAVGKRKQGKVAVGKRKTDKSCSLEKETQRKEVVKIREMENKKNKV